jgi:hypothetical protein
MALISSGLIQMSENEKPDFTYLRGLVRKDLIKLGKDPDNLTMQDIYDYCIEKNPKVDWLSEEKTKANSPS